MKKIYAYIRYTPADLLTICERFTSDYGTRFFINPDSLEVHEISQWIDDFLTWRDDEAIKDYHGDARAWIDDCLRFDTLRPVKACTVIYDYSTDEERIFTVDFYGTFDQAEKECKNRNFLFDDFFNNKTPFGSARPYEAIELMQVKSEDFIDFLLNPASSYDAPCNESILYGDIPE